MPDLNDGIVVEHLVVGPLGCNCTIVADPKSGGAIVIDGGAEPERIIERLDAHGVRATVLVHSHAHIDHIGCVGELKERTGAAALLHAGDLPLYRTLQAQAKWLGIAPPEIVDLDGDLQDGFTLKLGEASLDVLHTPGHTPGSVSFALTTPSRATSLLTGDTLFRGGIGRWDLGGTSMEDIVASIRAKLFVYDDETVVIPGHGPATTIGLEKRENPYAGVI